MTTTLGQHGCILWAFFLLRTRLNERESYGRFRKKRILIGNVQKKAMNCPGYICVARTFYALPVELRLPII